MGSDLAALCNKTMLFIDAEDNKFGQESNSSQLALAENDSFEKQCLLFDVKPSKTVRKHKIWVIHIF